MKDEKNEIKSGSISKLIVFGGNGFVGTRVCEHAIKSGIKVISVNRTGLI